MCGQGWVFTIEQNGCSPSAEYADYINSIILFYLLPIFLYSSNQSLKADLMTFDSLRLKVKELDMNKKTQLTMSNGCPVIDNQNVLTAGPRSPMLLEDV